MAGPQALAAVGAGEELLAAVERASVEVMSGGGAAEGAWVELLVGFAQVRVSFFHFTSQLVNSKPVVL